MRKSIKVAVIALALAGCAGKKEVVTTPVAVSVPVAEPCPAPDMDVPARPELPIKNITAASQMDRDADLWKATVLRLLGYVGALETAVASRDKVLAVCRGG